MRTMTTSLEEVQSLLCRQFCADIRLSYKNESLIRIETPFIFPDGDAYQIYLEELDIIGFRISDMGHTLMHLSYEHDIDLFRKGTRGDLLEQIQLELGLTEDNGVFYIESLAEDLPENIFKLGQGITKIYDLTYLIRFCAASTFFEDLEERIFNLIDPEKIQVNYFFPDMENAEDYLIDYRIEGRNQPLFLFGVPNRDKARLTTIILERLTRIKNDIESLIVFENSDLLTSRKF